MTTQLFNGRQTLLGALVAALAAVCFAALAGSDPKGAEAGGRACAHANATPQDVGVRKLRRAVGCLINSERVSRDRRRVRLNDDLARVATRHTKVMVRTDCLKHQCPGERPLKTRIERSGYLKPGNRYGYGEILGCSQTPASIVQGWMARRYDRRNILDRRFRHFGIGAKQGSPFPRSSKSCSPGRKHVTYTVLFGWRRR